MVFKTALLIGLVIFFAVNMGASGIAPSFATLFGSRLIKHKNAVVWFTLFIILGAVFAGHNVVKTLGKGFIGKITFEEALLILIAAACGLFIANILKVPQSTSWATVFSISGVGLALQKLQSPIFLKIIPFWIALPLIGFFITRFLYKLIYPPRKSNLWFYQKILCNEKKVRRIAFASSCYIAFACGSNNVPNAVGPLSGAGIISPLIGLIIIAPLFGIGALIFGKNNMKTVGEEVVPLGLISSSIIGFVSASLLLTASLIGIPQSMVQMSALSVMAVGSVKHEKHIFHGKTSKKIFLTWIITPLLSLLIGFTIAKIYALYFGTI